MTVLQPQGRQEGTQIRWATWKGMGRAVGLPWTPLLPVWSSLAKPSWKPEDPWVVPAG